MKYYKSTPPRFRTKRQDASAANKVPFVPHELTKPKTPKLITKTRSRSLCVESASEKEEKEVKEIERYVCVNHLMQPRMSNIKFVLSLRGHPHLIFHSYG